MSLSHDTTTTYTTTWWCQRHKSFGTFPRHLFERRCSHIKYFSYFQFHFLLKISRWLGSDWATLGLKRQRLRVATFYATMPTLCGSTSRTLYSCLSWHIVCLISSPSTFFQCPYYKLDGKFPPLGTSLRWNSVWIQCADFLWLCLSHFQIRWKETGSVVHKMLAIAKQDPQLSNNCCGVLTRSSQIL
jgi:hypothetical protein